MNENPPGQSAPPAAERPNPSAAGAGAAAGPEQTIRFDDGAAYEEFMGKWSQRAGHDFLDWLGAPAGLHWIDVGCGNGAFSELLFQQALAAQVTGVDPSAEQLAFARGRLPAESTRLHQGDALALPGADQSFDAAVMALVIFFVPEPAKGVAEMVRVVKPGGIVSAYAWDILGGGFPFAVLQEEMAALGAPPLWPPSVDAARMEALRGLWADAGLVDVHTHEIRVERTFPDFDTFWRVAKTGPRVAPRIDALPKGDGPTLQERLRQRLVAAPDGSVTLRAVANAVRGRRPG